MISQTAGKHGAHSSLSSIYRPPYAVEVPDQHFTTEAPHDSLPSYYPLVVVEKPRKGSVDDGTLIPPTPTSSNSSPPVKAFDVPSTVGMLSVTHKPAKKVIEDKKATTADADCAIFPFEEEDSTVKKKVKSKSEQQTAMDAITEKMASLFFRGWLS